MVDLTKSQKLLYILIQKYGIDDSKIKLAKFQYFIDFIHYAFHDKPVSDSNIEYDRQKYGPLSKSFNDDLSALIEGGFIEEIPKYHYKIKKQLDIKLAPTEQRTIDFVWNKYKHLTSQDLSDISHRQLPYQTAQPGGIVHLFTAYNLVDEYPDYKDAK